MVQLIQKWVMSCKQCIKESRVDHILIIPALRNPFEHITGPKDAKQFDLVPEVTSSSGYEDVVTAIEVSYR